MVSSRSGHGQTVLHANPGRHSGACHGCWSSTTPRRDRSRALTEAVVAGAHDDAIEGVEVVVREALAFARGEADHQDLLDADGYVLGTTANFGYMSGAMKHVFDSTFLQIGGALSDDGSGEAVRGRHLVRARSGSTCTVATTRPGPSGRCCRSPARSAGSRGTTCSRRWAT